MNRLTVKLKDRSYPIIIENNCLEKTGKIINSVPNLPKKGIIISNKKVFSLYGKIESILKKNGYELHHFLVPEGEKAKSLLWAEKIYKFLINHKMDRNTFLIALGGGVVGDLTGFAAATFMRGIPFIQIPTSLLAQVDSSVGGKVAVNLKEGKNLIGCFYQPKLVIIDPTCLNTLPKREFTNGMSEVIKYSLIRDKNFFSFLFDNQSKIKSLDFNVIGEMIYNSVKNKAEIVSRDETEKSIRAILNFGHTFGHSIEKTWNYKTYSHGEAVAIGMSLACEYSNRIGILKQTDLIRIKELFKIFNLKTQIKTKKFTFIFKNLFFDKKVTDKKLVFILIEGIGKAILSKEIDEQDLKSFLKQSFTK